MTLVDKWDLSKSLLFELDDEVYRRKEAIFAGLAYWQYIELSNKKEGITYEKAKNTVTDILHNKLKLVDEFIAEKESEKFMDYARKRSIYFDNNFTHKTYLEYYTAFWIFTNIEKKHNKEKRNEIIKTYIDNSFWHIVLELLFNLIDKDQPDNEIMDEMILTQSYTSKNTLSFLLNVLPSLKNVSSSCTMIIIESGIKNILSTKIQVDNAIFIELSRYTTKEKYSQYIESAFDSLSTGNLSKTKTHKLLSLYYELHHNNYEIDETKYTFHDKQIFKNILRNDYRLSFYDIIIFRDKELNNNSLTLLADYTIKFGKENCLSEIQMKYTNVIYISLAKICMNNFLRSDNINNISYELNKLESVGYNDTDIFSLLVNRTVRHLNTFEIIRRLFVLLNNINSSKIETYLLIALNSLINNQYYIDQKNKVTEIVPIIKNDEMRTLINLIIESNYKVGQTVILNKYNLEDNILENDDFLF